MCQVGLFGLRFWDPMTNLTSLKMCVFLFISSKHHMLCSDSISKACDIFSDIFKASCGWLLTPHRHSRTCQRIQNALFPCKKSTYPPCVWASLSPWQGVSGCLWSLPAKAPPCQSVSQHLVRCLSHWIWHVVHWWQQWADFFFFVISSLVPRDPMSNYTPATNLITVAEEIAWFNSFQLDLIGAVRSDITHLGRRAPITVVSFEAWWGGHDMMTESESSNTVNTVLWKTTFRSAHITGILWWKKSLKALESKSH